MATPGQSLFVRDMLFNLASVVDWRVVTAAKQQQVDIYNTRENTGRATHYYAIGDLVCVEMNGTSRIIEDKKQGPYIITKFFIDTAVRFQRVQVN